MFIVTEFTAGRPISYRKNDVKDIRDLVLAITNSETKADRAYLRACDMGFGGFFLENKFAIECVHDNGRVCMNNIELAIVNTHEMNVYCWCASENAEKKLQEAREYAETWSAECTRRITAYPHMSDYWRKQAERYRLATYKAMTWEQFAVREREKLLSGKPDEITEELFRERLNVLPPLHYVRHGGVEEFCMSEMYTGSYTEQYAHDHETDKYWCKMVDVCDSSTWLHNILRAQTV